MTVTITTNFETTDGVYSGIRKTMTFTSFTRLYSSIVKEYKQAKIAKQYIQIDTNIYD